MSAEILRRAAALMRERAEAATPGPWEADPHGVVRGGLGGVVWVGSATADAAHIASWHPAVALAVADWLADTAWLIEQRELREGTVLPARALAVARAYLGEES